MSRDRLCDNCKRRMIAGGSAFIKWVCACCFEIKDYHMTAAPRICNNCSKKHNRCQRCLEKLK